MTRPRLRSTVLRLVLPSLALSLAACSFSFKTGSGPGDVAGKPAKGTDGPAPAEGPGKPVAGAEPAADPEPTTETDPERTADPDAPAPNTTLSAPTTAVCRVDDAEMLALCHQVLDPIAADDLVAWTAVLGDEVVLTRPSMRAGSQRLQGPEAVESMAGRTGGLRQLMHVQGSDRIVGTLANDCRDCRRAFVAFEANTRTGTTVIRVDMTQPPRVTSVSVGSNLRRGSLSKGGATKPTAEPTKPTVSPTIEPTKPQLEPTEPAKPSKPAKKTTLEAPSKSKAELKAGG
ncbi:MAG: hypothetical protein AB1Z98_04795 [Nannocystaceae bacterium]